MEKIHCFSYGQYLINPCHLDQFGKIVEDTNNVCRFFIVLKSHGVMSEEQGKHILFNKDWFIAVLGKFMIVGNPYLHNRHIFLKILGQGDFYFWKRIFFIKCFNLLHCGSNRSTFLTRSSYSLNRRSFFTAGPLLDENP